MTSWGGDRIGRLLDAVPDPTLVVDASGVVQFANGEAAVMVGRPRHELLGRHVRELVPEWGTVERSHHESGAPAASPASARHRNGRSIPVELTVTTSTTRPARSPSSSEMSAPSSSWSRRPTGCGTS